MSLTTTKTLTHALKEWAVAVNALKVGKTIVLLRKGGIKDAGKQFQVPDRKVCLYPTYEHQKPELLKTEYSSAITSVVSGWHPEIVSINSCAEITDVLSIEAREKVDSLLSYHIWNEQFVRDRLDWKPHQPIAVLLLRTYQLPQTVDIPFHQTYGGCKSWIDLIEPICIDNLIPVLDDRSYAQKVTQIKKLL